MNIKADTSEKGGELFYFHSVVTEMRRVWNSTDELQRIIEGSWFSFPIVLQGKGQRKCPYIKAIKRMDIFDFMERGTSENQLDHIQETKFRSLCETPLPERYFRANCRFCRNFE